MKKIHIIAIVIIAVSISVLSMAAKDVATYATFSDAAKSGGKVKVAGQLCKDKPMQYNPEKDADKFSFFLKDTEGKLQQVVLLKPKPQDFEMSEQVVCTGEMKEGLFVANDVLLKCPSKYKDEEIYNKTMQVK
jgi:cytochrome c-type biogenesis protein CcmE